MHLYFKHANQTYSLVKTNVEDTENIWIIIYSDVKKRNPDFKITEKRRYYDAWGRVHFGVGSPTEDYMLM